MRKNLFIQRGDIGMQIGGNAQFSSGWELAYRSRSNRDPRFAGTGIYRLGGANPLSASLEPQNAPNPSLGSDLHFFTVVGAAKLELISL